MNFQKLKKGKHDIISDFIQSRDDVEGSGYFRGDKQAIEYSDKLTNNQLRKWRRYGIVPKSFLEMISCNLLFRGKSNPLYRDINYSELLALLIQGPYKSERGRQVCEKLFHDFIVTYIPWLEKSFAKADFIYKSQYQFNDQKK